MDNIYTILNCDTCWEKKQGSKMDAKVGAWPKFEEQVCNGHNSQKPQQLEQQLESCGASHAVWWTSESTLAFTLNEVGRFQKILSRGDML